MTKLVFTVEAETPQELMVYVKADELYLTVQHIAETIRSETKYGQMTQESLTNLVQRIRTDVIDVLAGMD
jgi:hypothetical protein